MHETARVSILRTPLLTALPIAVASAHIADPNALTDGDTRKRQPRYSKDNLAHNRGLVCRTGGEEITIFFPGVALGNVESVCQEIRQAVEDLRVKTTDMHGRTHTAVRIVRVTGDTD